VINCAKTFAVPLTGASWEEIAGIRISFFPSDFAQFTANKSRFLRYRMLSCESHIQCDLPVNMMGVGKNDLSEVTHRVFPMKYYTVPQRNYITPSFAAREDFLEYSGVQYGTLRRDITYKDPVYSPVDGD